MLLKGAGGRDLGLSVPMGSDRGACKDLSGFTIKCEFI